MGTAVKLAAIGFVMWFATEYCGVVSEVFSTAKESVAGIEVSQVDTAVRLYDMANDHLPKDQEEFVEACHTMLEQKGRDSAKDQWGTTFRYEKLGRRSFRITSAGADAQFGTSDDIALERKGDKATVNRDVSTAIAEAIDKQTENVKELAERAQQLGEMLSEESSSAASTATPADASRAPGSTAQGTSTTTGPAPTDQTATPDGQTSGDAASSAASSQPKDRTSKSSLTPQQALAAMNMMSVAQNLARNKLSRKAIQQYEKVIRQFPSSELADRARREIQRLRDAKEK